MAIAEVQEMTGKPKPNLLTADSWSVGQLALRNIYSNPLPHPKGTKEHLEQSHS